jgi:hypothetical protein
MKIRTNHKGLNFVVSITLFTVFAMMLMLVLLTGASAFRNIAEQSQERFNSRTPLLYISNRLQNVESVQILMIDDTQVLLMNDEFFDIYIYFYDGLIRELYHLPELGDPVRLELGMELFPAQSLTFASIDDLPLTEVVLNSTQSVFVSVEVAA